MVVVMLFKCMDVDKWGRQRSLLPLAGKKIDRFGTRDTFSRIATFI